MRYDTKNKKWEDICDLNICRSQAAATVLAGKLYVVGGLSQMNSTLKSVERYVADANRWIEVSEMNVGRALHRCCCIKGNIYAVGGSTICNRKTVDLCSIEKYDEQIDKWTIVS